MLITKKLGNLSSFIDEGRVIDRLPLEWHETARRSLRKQTGSGREIRVQMKSGAQPLQQDDVLYADEKCLIVVEILACQTLVLKLSNLYQAAKACYVIGNKRLPLFFEEDTLLIPYEASVYSLLQEAGFEPHVVNRKLLHRLRVTNSEPASRSAGRENFISRIFRLSTPSVE